MGYRAPNSFSSNVGDGWPGMFVASWVDASLVSAVSAPLGLGEICSANTNSRFSAVPSGTQLIKVSIGLSVWI